MGLIVGGGIESVSNVRSALGSKGKFGDAMNKILL